MTDAVFVLACVLADNTLQLTSNGETSVHTPTQPLHRLVDIGNELRALGADEAEAITGLSDEDVRSGAPVNLLVRWSRALQ
jgi:hypothetical protein